MQLGWLTGLEPATPGVTVQCSTIELQPPKRGEPYKTLPRRATVVRSDADRPDPRLTHPPVAAQMPQMRRLNETSRP